VRPAFVVIVSATLNNPTELRLAQNDEVIEALAPDRTDQPFDAEFILF
jgi:hypothetical protein